MNQTVNDKSVREEFRHDAEVDHALTVELVEEHGPWLLLLVAHTRPLWKATGLLRPCRAEPVLRHMLGPAGSIMWLLRSISRRPGAVRFEFPPVIGFSLKHRFEYRA